MLVTAPPEILAAALAQRTRADSVSDRIGRAVSDDVRPDVVIDTVGPVEANAERLLDVILRFVPAIR